MVCGTTVGNTSPLHRRYSTPLTSSCDPTRTLLATACVMTRAPAASASWSVLSALYLACAGQPGMQLEFPSHRSPAVGRPTAPTGWNPRPPSYCGFGIELRPPGTGTTPVGYGSCPSRPGVPP